MPPCPRVCPLARETWCPVQRKARDHPLGEASNPESVAHSTDQIPLRPRVLPGQQICPGDIVTMRNNDGIVRVESVTKSGDGMNWGDVSGGAYVALESVDTVSAPGRLKTIPVFASGTRIVSILDADASLGSHMGVDLRVAEGDKRVGRRDPVTCSTDHRLDSELWQRTRVMSKEDLRDGIRKKAFLGQLVEIITPSNPLAGKSVHGDYGRIVIQPQPYS